MKERNNYVKFRNKVSKEINMILNISFYRQ